MSALYSAAVSVSTLLARDVFSRPCVEPRNPTHASTSMQCGKAVFENDNYRISANDNNTVSIYNKHSGESYEASGDPHVSVDGKHAFDFYGKTTFQLEDGTKVTIGTTPDKNNPGATLSSTVTITNDDYGVQITGVDGNRQGDLALREFNGEGHRLDARVGDGNLIQENPAGPGFLGVDRQGKIHAVDQDYINRTDSRQTEPSRNDGCDAMASKYADAFRQLAHLLAVYIVGQLSPKGQSGQDGGCHQAIDHCVERPQDGHGQVQVSLNVSLAVSISQTFACLPPAPQPPVCEPVAPPVCAPAPAPEPAPAPPPAEVCLPEPVVIDNGGGGDGDGGGCGNGDGGGSCGI